MANPANTNCLVAIKAAPAIPSKNFSCLTRLDEQRLRGICSERVHKKLNIKPTTVKNVFIFGNHSTTQVAHISNGSALLPDGSEIPLSELLEGQGDPLKSDYKYILNTVQNRGAEIIKKMQVSSALSAAEAIGKVFHITTLYQLLCMYVCVYVCINRYISVYTIVTYCMPTACPRLDRKLS